MEKKYLLKQLPKMDVFAEKLKIKYDFVPYEIIIRVGRKTLDNLRGEILDGKISDFNEEMLFKIAKEYIDYYTIPSLKPIINGTGVIIHTNLGRSPLSERISNNVFKVASRYSNLEYDVETGQRGSRYEHVENKLKELTGAESALVVNNNAAAVMLILNTLCQGKEAVVSRGELVEIGGSFRIPEVMKLSGALLREVGCTNRTHLYDYEDAINENTAMIMKIHPSNFKIMGFKEEVLLPDLVKLSLEKNVILYNDIGSSSLVPINTTKFKIPVAYENISDGVDILSFSGDKMVGGPQAGIIVGKKRYIDKMKKNHLLRAFRIDKLSLTALECTLMEYFYSKDDPKIPIVEKISMDISKTYEESHKLAEKLKYFKSIDISIGEDESTIGGGSLPEEFIKSYVVFVKTKNIDIISLEKRMRNWKVPIICRIKEDKILIDPRTLFFEDYEEIFEFFKDFEGDTL